MLLRGCLVSKSPTQDTTQLIRFAAVIIIRVSLSAVKKKCKKTLELRPRTCTCRWTRRVVRLSFTEKILPRLTAVVPKCPAGERLAVKGSIADVFKVEKI